ncbi:hypothetical protein [Herpetosiphon giganteus]|uniref:hypothetical protein n=1 Tax=Herpetosiphon giganteus TaxID=2029754 RepID=UPI00195AD15B|nr:hypothetical protein [Herpetosiphon giganteus]MBM7845377.1 hypothetical protein [Herpetosiphon giganteus]
MARNLTHQNPIVLCDNQRIYFRDLFRSARAKAQKNAEDFQDILFALEKLGITLTSPKKGTDASLKAYQTKICALISTICLDTTSPYYIDPEKLYTAVTYYRNDALHQGAVARNLTSHAIRLALLIEAALMSNQDTVNAFMVSNVVVAEDWHPISFVRQQMLGNSFSYLPLFHEDDWYLISDYHIVKYLRFNLQSNNQRIERLSTSIKAALTDTNNQLYKEKANLCYIDTTILEVLEKNINKPFIVTCSNNRSRILGVITPFDIL